MKAKKSLGQNFLVNVQTSRRIVDAVSPSADEIVIEIGPGRGALTGLLTERAGLVLAIELDRELVELLNNEFSSPCLKIVAADVLKCDIPALIAEARDERPGLQARARVVANLPYYISTAVIQQLIDARAILKDMTVMLQREVAERIVSAPGGKDYGSLSVLVQLYCTTRIILNVPPGAFRPAPKVDSRVLQLVVRDKPLAPVTDEQLFERVVRACFSQRRKTIYNNLKAAAATISSALTPAEINNILTAAAIAPERRAETLDCAQFARLTNAIFELIEGGA